MNGRIQFIGGPCDGLEIIASQFPAVAVRVGMTDAGQHVLVPSMRLNAQDTELYTPNVHGGRMAYEWVNA
jgi:hypothetical protein